MAYGQPGYGLLLASGARRYCRAAIRGVLSLSPSCSLPVLPSPFRHYSLLPAPVSRSFLVPHQREWWRAGRTVKEEEEGLVGRGCLRRHAGSPRTRIALGRKERLAAAAAGALQVILSISFSFHSSIHRRIVFRLLVVLARCIAKFLPIIAAIRCFR